MKNKRILITGGLGFIFSHVTEYFAQQGNTVTVLDNLSDGSHPELLEKWQDLPITFYKGDVNDILLLQKKWLGIGFDYIVHAAAESNVDKSIDNQKAFIHSNIYGTYSILEYARQFHQALQGFLYVNTDEVYGATEHWCDAKKHPINPSNPYSASKAAGGGFCWAYNNTYGLPMQEIRMCNIVGRRQATTKLLPRVIERIQKGQAIPVYDGGEQTREYMDVRDVPKLIEYVLDDGREEIVNLTFNQEHSTMQVIETVARILGKQPKLEPSSRPGHDKRYRIMPSPLLFNEVGHAKFKGYDLAQTIEWILGESKPKKSKRKSYAMT